MRIRVLFFGVLRDIVGLREDSVEIPDGSHLGSVFEHYAGKCPRLREMSASLVLALNQSFSEPGAPLSEGDEVALLPPVSGGSAVFTQVVEDPDGHFFAITRDPIDSLALAHRLQRGEDGAVVTFEGITRNNTKGRPTRYLEYECYEAMAIKMMAQIGREIAGALPIGRIGMIHRLGRLEIGEASVAIVAAAPHRKPAFDAALEGINRLKKLVPIWKKEYFADGEVWVDGEWDDSVTKARS
ncbi:MAG: molybdenum cofactor biosynthesis protein MoaE [Bryobacteraceae bacterium]